MKLVKALWSNISCRKLSGLLIGEYTPVHTDNIVPMIRVSKTSQSRTVKQKMFNGLVLSVTEKTHWVDLNTLGLILTTLPGQFQDVHSPDKLSDHDIVSGTLKIFIPPIKKPRRKVYLYQKGDYESMRKDTLEFAKEKYFNGHSDTRSVQENFCLH